MQQNSYVVPAVELKSGAKLPKLVFGVYQIRDLAACQKAVEEAIAAGYRAVDTAAGYRNEAAVGAALKACGVPREEISVTTKVWVQDMTEAGSRKAVMRSLELLGLDYLDICLIHHPVGDIYGVWRTLKAMQQEGFIRDIGVSNFEPDRLIDLVLGTDVTPAINQIEINPFFQHRESIDFMKTLGVVPQAWAPFAQARNGLFTNPVLESIAQKHQRSVAQVVLRWVLELGAVAVSKSVTPERIRENILSANFDLDQEDMAAIEKLDTGKSQFFSHRDPEFIKKLHSIRFEH